MQINSLGKGLFLVTAVVFITACANQNALLQSPTANSTASIDQITAELDAALVQPAPPELSNDVLSALTPELAGSKLTANIEPRFDIAVNNVNAADFFAGLVAVTRQKIVVHPDVQGRISLNLKDVTVAEVLEVTQSIYGFEFQKNGRLIKVFPSGKRTRIFNVNYLDIARKGGSETRVSSGQITMNGGGDSGSSSNGDESGGGSTGQSTMGTQINTQSEHRFWQDLKQTLNLIVGGTDGGSVVITPSAGVDRKSVV